MRILVLCTGNSARSQMAEAFLKSFDAGLEVYSAGTVKKRVHIGFEDPARASGTEEEVLGIFREVRDQIRRRFSELYANELRQRQGPSCGDEPPH